MKAMKLAKVDKRVWLHVSMAAALVWLLPLQLLGQSSRIDSELSVPAESPSNLKHVDDHDHPIHDDSSHQNSTTAESTSLEDHDPESTHDHKHDHENPNGLLSRIISYLGKFHPPMVNYPIAMLMGAALAEILLMITGRSLFADAARYCIWIGALGSLAAGTLGWFLGGFHLSDSRWVMTAHRWLGTTTVVWAILVLILSELQYRPGPMSRTPYRGVLFVGALLVSVTGFFGGALIYGINHYAW